MKSEKFIEFATHLVEDALPDIQRCYHIDISGRVVTLARDGVVCVYVEGYTPKWDVVAKDWTALGYVGNDDYGTVTVAATTEYELKMPRGDYSQCIWVVIDGDCLKSSSGSVD